MTSVDRIQGLSGSLAVKTPCRVATTANITLSGEQTIDAVAVVDGDRVLVKNQTDTTENGIYNVSTGHWTRSLDFDGANDVVDGTMVYARAGTANAELFFRVNGTEPIIPGDVAISLTPANPLATVSSFAATLLDDADADAARSTLGAAGLSVENTFTALATFALGLTVSGAAFASLGIQDDATARVLTLSGSGANSITMTNSATDPVIGTSGGALLLQSATGAVVANGGANVALFYGRNNANTNGAYYGVDSLGNAYAWNANTAVGSYPFYVGNGSANNTGPLQIVTAGVTQVLIPAVAGANRYITLAGSNGGSPTIGTSGGDLSVSSNFRTENGALVYGQNSANFVLNNALMVGALAKASAVSGNSGTLLIRSNDAANRLEGYVQLVTSATAGSRRLVIFCVEQGVATREVDIGSPIIFTSQTVGTTVGAAGGASALPATPLGYLTTNINGTACKIPYYN